MAKNITVGIDIGTYQVKIVVAELSREERNGRMVEVPRILGTGIAESKGLRHGYIIHGSEVTESIRSAAAQAEKASGIRIRKAFIAVGGIGLSGITSTATTVVSRADFEVSDL